MPYPAILLDFAITEAAGGVARFVVAAAHVAQTRLRIIPYYAVSGSNEVWAAGLGMAELDPSDAGTMKIYGIRKAELTDPVIKDCYNIVVIATEVLMCFLALLDSNDREIRDVPAPAKLNKKRHERARCSIPAFHSVSLRLPRSRKGAGQPATNGAGNRHARPHTHWRAGHRREYRPGEFTRVKAALINAELGNLQMSTPSYRVRTVS